MCFEFAFGKILIANLEIVTAEVDIQNQQQCPYLNVKSGKLKNVEYDTVLLVNIEASIFRTKPLRNRPHHVKVVKDSSPHTVHT